MLRGERKFSAEIWLERYLAHPITGQISRRLFWKADENLIGFEPPGKSGASFSMTTIDGSTFSLPDSAGIRLWHPCELTESDRLAWERRVLDRRLIQPFQQALRAAHRPEAGTGRQTEDHRFAGEFIRQGTVAALSRERGWNYSFHPCGIEFEPPVGLSGSALRATVRESTEVRNGKEGAEVWHRIEGIRFYVKADFKEAIALEKVPPVMFSEVMRDLELFIATSHAAKV